MDSYAIAAGMAVEGAGVCLLNDELVNGSCLQSALVAPFEEGIECMASYYLIKLHEKPLSGAAQAFHDWLLKEIG